MLDLQWRKSTRSNETNCVEVRVTTAGDVLVRDSKNPLDGLLEFDSAAWRGFVAAVKVGEFDR